MTAKATGGAATFSSEDATLKAKFCSLAFTSPNRAQRASECVPEKQKAMQERSYQLWKKLNPGYYVSEEESNTTTSRDMQRYEQADFVVANKSNNRRRDQHTAFVNSLALARGKN